MSILESIEAAEQEAEQIRKQAAANGRELIRAAQANAQQELAKRVETAREQAKEAICDAQNQANKQAESLLGERRTQNERFAEQARQQLPAAVRSIVERVLS